MMGQAEGRQRLGHSGHGHGDQHIGFGWSLEGWEQGSKKVSAE